MVLEDSWSDWNCFDLKDIMSRLEISELSNHDIYFGTNNAIDADGDKIEITFGTDWDFGALAYTDLVFQDAGLPLTLAGTAGTDTWGVDINDTTNVITLTAPTDGVGYISNGHILRLQILNEVISNPSSVGSYPIEILITTAGNDPEDGSVQIPIVDSDQVMISGYVDSYLFFDIDTGYTTNDLLNPVGCDSTGCTNFNGGIATGNYSVDLGQMSYLYINKSKESQNHDGVSGEINSIYFDLTSNAVAGATVSVKSANGGLQGPVDLIGSVAVDGDDITEGSGTYGYSLLGTPTYNHGTVILNPDCSVEGEYCGPNTAPKLVFNSDSHPVDTARVRMDLAAAAKYTNTPGSYTDTLTFIATATY